jgi:hypothetical protein
MFIIVDDKKNWKIFESGKPKICQRYNNSIICSLCFLRSNLVFLILYDFDANDDRTFGFITRPRFEPIFSRTSQI